MIDAITAQAAKLRLKAMRWSGAVVLRGIGGTHLPRRALLHYKIDPLFDGRLAKTYRHTNGWEVPELVRILNEFGFTVDLVDRSNRTWMPNDDYDLLISNASGNSGRLYPIYADRLTRAIKIFYALGPEPGEANRRVFERYDFLKERKGIELPTMRVMDKVDIERCMAVSDAIVCLDDNGYSSSTYARYGLPLYLIHPSASPRATFDPRWLESRRRSSFLAFTGDGFFAKGIDLLVEAFLDRPQAELFIAGPRSDKAFFEQYGAVIKNSPNIRYEGFLPIGGARYRDLMARCSWVISPPASEGCATSVTTCMRSGLVPITSRTSSVDVSTCGHLLTSNVRDLPVDIRDAIDALMPMQAVSYAARVHATLLKAQDYSEAMFTSSWSRALAQVLYGDSVAHGAGRKP